MASKSSRSAAKDSSVQSVRVFVRCRPMSHAETHQKCIPAVDILNQKEIAVQDRSNSKLSKTFAFDKIFGASSGQVEVYHTVVEPFIADVLAGFNCTVFAYGQTGTGKTHTMEGELYEDPNKLHDPDSRAGILPRTMCALFDELRVLQAEYTVRISFLELYNEEIYDLLSPDAVPPKLRMFDDSTKKGSVIIQGLQEVMVHTRAQVFAELRKGSAKKQVAATLINANSSRSHTVFCVTVHMKENSMHGEELLKTGKLYLVDLAGSESIGRSGSVDKRAREAGSINQSLLTLSRVISGLIDRHPHIPYRESKLTRLLQDSLGGRTKTSIIATICPAYSNVEETLSTLDYAHRAKRITNRPEINQKVSKKVIMKEYMDVIEDLKKKLDLHREGSGIYIAEKNYEEMQSDLTERDKELSEIVAEMKAVSRKMESAEQTFQHLTSALKEKNESVKEADQMLKLMRTKVAEGEKILETIKEDNMEANELVSTVAEQEEELRKRASILLSVVDDYNSDRNRIHERLQLSRALIKSNEEVLSDLHQVFMNFDETIRSKTSSLLSKLTILAQVVELWENEKCETDKDVTYFKKSLSVLSRIGRDSMKRFSEALNKKHCWKNDLNKKSFSEMKSTAERSISEIKTIHLVVTSACAKLQKLASKIPKEVLKLVSLSTKKCAEFAEICCREKENLYSTFDDIDTAVVKQGHDIEEFIDTLVLSIQQENNRQLDNFKKSQQSINDVNAILLALNSSNTLHVSEAKNNFSKIEGRLAAMDDLAHDFNGTVEDNLKNAQSVSEDTKAKINDACTSVLNDLSDNLSKIIPMHESAMQIVDGMSVSAKMFIDDEANAFKTLEATAESSVMNRRDICSVQEEERIVNEVENALPITTVGLMKRRQNVIERVESFIAQPCSILKPFDSEIASVGFEVKNIICDQRNLLDDTIESKVDYDRPTGCTPARRPAINLPKAVFLPSPYEKKVKSRVQNAVEKIKRVQLKFKKNHVMDVDDECMASDSEVTYLSRDPKPTALAKSSSLVDLRTIHSFSRPQAPAGKKFRKVAKRMM